MSLSSKINVFLGLQSQIKINHWQTKKYSRHEAFGEFYDNMDELIDQFIEVYMGKYGRFVLNDDEKTIPLFNLSELNIKGLLETVKNFLVIMGDELDEKDSDLLSIRDDMIAEVDKLNYLLTLK